MVSLSNLCEVTEEGVKFENPYDKSQMKISPEDSINIQNVIGSDIMMALDDVVKTTSNLDDIEKSCDRTIRWISRNIKANKNPQS